MNNPAKAYLQRYRAARARYASLCREINDLRESLMGTTVQLKQDVVKGSGASDRMGATVAKIVDMESAISGEAAEVAAILNEVLAAIRAVHDETQRAVLTMRYIEGLGWQKIAENIHYEISNTYILHGRALSTVNRWMEGAKRGENEQKTQQETRPI